MKKNHTLLPLTALALACLSTLVLTACRTSPAPTPPTDGETTEKSADSALYDAFFSAYRAAVESGYEGSFDAWLTATLLADRTTPPADTSSVETTAPEATRPAEPEPDPILESGEGYVLITDYARPDTGEDVSAAIQKAINENPNKTLFFPDGVYLIAKPIRTPAAPEKSVSLKLANYATIKATDDWRTMSAMIRLGGKDPANDIHTPGSNYFLEGGILDGSGVASGISIESGRETYIAHVSIKNTQIGIHIKHGANSGSSDADIIHVNIVGNNEKGSTGVLIEGYDNTLTDMRIAGVQYGIHLIGGGNFIRNVHPLYIWSDAYSYADSIGFWEESGGNFFDNAYSDQFATAFQINGWQSVFDDCFAFWYADMGPQTGFYCTGAFQSVIQSPRINFNVRTARDATFFYTATHGSGRITTPMFDPSLCDPARNHYSHYLQDGEIVIP